VVLLDGPAPDRGAGGLRLPLLRTAFPEPYREQPEAWTNLIQNYDSVTVLTLPADNGTWSVVLATSNRDRALRALRDPSTFDAALAQYPLAAHGRDGEPISGVDVMAGIEDRHRRLVVDGEPIAAGVMAVGDAWACTNPSLGRGTSIGLLHARSLRDGPPRAARRSRRLRRGPCSSNSTTSP
jgi:hypothetical protein